VAPGCQRAERRGRERCARGPGHWAESALGQKKERGKGNGPGGILGCGAKLGCGLGKKAMRWLGRQADREGFPLSLFFSNFFSVFFSKTFSK